MISMGREDGAMEEDEAQMMERMFQFGDRLVAEIMTPRTNIVWVEKGATLREFLETYGESPHSRFRSMMKQWTMLSAFCGLRMCSSPRLKESSARRAW